MGRHLNRRDSDIEFQGYLPGCVWSILHILDYHHWNSAKKSSLHRKNRRGKHTICCGYPKTVSFEHYTDEVHNYLDADAVPLLDEQQTAKAAPTEGISGKARIKALVAKEMSARSRLQRTGSILHLEPTDGLGGISADWSNPIIILQRSADTTASGLLVPSLPKSSEERVICNGENYLRDTMDDESCFKQNSLSVKQEISSEKGDKLMNSSLHRNLSDARQLRRESSCRQFVDSADVLELFKVNKKLFLEILQDPNFQANKKFHVQLTSNSKARLKKSGSFPSADSAHISYLRPSTLEHKQKEIWSLPKGEKFPAGVEAPKFVASKSSEDSHDKSTGLKADDSGVVSVAQETDFSSSASSQGSNKHGWHQSFMNHLKDVMKKIKHTLKESKKEDNHKSMNALLHRVPSRHETSTDEKETPVSLKDCTIHQDGKENPTSFHETNGSDNSQLPRIRRVSSLNESLDRYARLFEYSLTREAKLHAYQSKSLKLSNEDKFPSTGHSLKSFKRRLSLPDLESFYPLPNETSDDTLHSEMPIKTAMDYGTNADNDSRNDLKSVRLRLDRKQFEPLEAVEETELQKNMVEDGNSCEHNECSGIEEKIAKTEELHVEMVELEKEGCSPCQDQEIVSVINSSREHEKQSLVSVFETDFREDVTGQAELSVSKGSELDSRHTCIEEPNSSVDLQDESSRDSLTGCCRSTDRENDENTHTMVDDQFLHFKLNELDATDFSYVRDVLEISGLIEQGCLGTWHSLDQPLSPTLFKELEAYIHHELECSSENVGYNCDHQLLFDLINEVLLKIYESSLAYFPKSFSSVQHVHPLPKGNHILEEVWKRISWYRSPRLKTDQSLDDIVSRDLAKDESWMNLQLDVEDIALDLEDLIFDELLDEVMHS